MCKSSFDRIIKYEDAAANQKVYSQTIPCGIPISNIFILPDRELQNYGYEVCLFTNIHCFLLYLILNNNLFVYFRNTYHVQ